MSIWSFTERNVARASSLCWASAFLKVGKTLWTCVLLLFSLSICFNVTGGLMACDRHEKWKPSERYCSMNVSLTLVFSCVHTDEITNLLLQIMTCALAPPVSNSAPTTSVELSAPVTPATATTGSATEKGRSPTVWVRPCATSHQDYLFYKLHALIKTHVLFLNNWKHQPSPLRLVCTFQIYMLYFMCKLVLAF